MFSYRHAFHAGNHADVLKHVVLVQVLLYACQKETPLFYIDTHAGEGVYSLEGREALKSAESQSGTARLWEDTTVPAAVKDYLQAIRDLNSGGKLRFYPGSPFIADIILRDQDRLRLFEWHPSEVRILEENFLKRDELKRKAGKSGRERGKRIMIEKKDGFLSLKALLPPPSRRGVVLIDPPYEDKADYRKVVETVSDAVKRFPTGTYLVWYPLLQRPESRRFASQLKQASVREWLNVSLSTGHPVPDGYGFVSSGMFIINPPWKLADCLKETMPYLVSALQKNSGAGFTLEAGTGNGK